MPTIREPATTGNPNVFEKSCGYCGARFRVVAAPITGLVHHEEYACPECGKSYAIEAAREPQVELLQARRDGKDDQYQETLF